jgi:hypothetical protein
MPPGYGFVYRDQATAEQAADNARGAHRALLDVLEELNKSLDSHKLHNLIENQKEALRA